MIGIYKFTNKIDGKVYVGQSINIKRRYNSHKYQSVSKNYPLNHNSHFHSAIRKYGFENFTFEILEECSKSQLNEKEIYWISFFDSSNRKKGYNISKGGSSKKVQSTTRTVCSVDITTYKIAKIYESVADAALDVDGNTAAICGCCKKQRGRKTYKRVYVVLHRRI